MKKPDAKIFYRRIGMPPSFSQPKFNSWRRCLGQARAAQEECTNWQIRSSFLMKYKRSQFVPFTCSILQFGFLFIRAAQRLYFVLLRSLCLTELCLFNAL